MVSESNTSLAGRSTLRVVWSIGLLIAVGLLIAACQPIRPMEEGESAAAPAASEGASTMKGDAAHGQYLATLNGCGCHFNRDLGAPAGGNKFEGDFGVVYASNLTPDKETGIGNWTEEQFAAALRTGAKPDGEVLAPAMPYQFYGSILSEQDAYDLAAYFLSQHALSNPLPENEVKEGFTAEAFTPPADAADLSDPVARGDFFVKLSGCGMCHNPTNEDGSPKPDMMLAGGKQIREEVSANLTPDEETGIGSWTEEQIAHYLKTAEKPDGSKSEGAMGGQIKNRFSKLTDEDAAGVAAYLKSIPAVSNEDK